MIKVIVLDQKTNKKVTTYDGKLIPMMGDYLDLPTFGIVKVVERIFEVDKPDEVIIKVKR